MRTKCLRALAIVTAAMLTLIIMPTSPGVTKAAAAAGPVTITTAFTSGYTWYDNSPPGTAICCGVLHQQAGGTGTYGDPITLAAGLASPTALDYAPGTRFYMPDVRRYFMVEDSCGSFGSGGCHYLGNAAPGATTWVDRWVGGTASDSQSAVQACANYLTDDGGTMPLHTIVENPPAGLPVVSGPLFQNGQCTAVYGNGPPPPTCTSVTGSVSPASTAPAGAPVMISGIASGCPNPLYRFWVQPPGGAWSIAQDYSTGASFSWSVPATAGGYRLEVDARDQTSAAAYDSVANLNYSITGGLSCTNAGLSPNSASPSAPGTQVTWSAASAGCPNPRYRFWEADPGAGWTIVQDYSANSSLVWNSPSVAGSYRFEVDLRDSSEFTSYDVVANRSYLLQATTPSCTNAALTTTPTSAAATGATVTLAGSSATCPNPRYRFWVQAPGGPWLVKQDYSAASTFSWSGTGSAGSYRLEVDVRDQAEGSSVSYDTVSNLTYAVNGCSAVSLNASPPNTAAHGSNVTLIASATCPGTATYKFWVRAPGGAWTVVRGYGTTRSFTWTPSTSGTYYLEVDVIDQGGTDAYDRVSNLTYQVN